MKRSSFSAAATNSVRNCGRRLIDGADTDPARVEHERQVREARLRLTRSQPNWTELAPAERLVRRGPFLVDSETDLLCVRRPGVVFEPGCATVGYLAPGTPMTFYVDQPDNVTFVEQPGGPQTWSDIVQRKAARR